MSFELTFDVTCSVTCTICKHQDNRSRAPLGAVKSRKQTSANFTKTLPGVPDGEYVVIQYATDFANRAGVTETVVPMRLPDGSWKVTTYLIR